MWTSKKCGKLLRKIFFNKRSFRRHPDIPCEYFILGKVGPRPLLAVENANLTAPNHSEPLGGNSPLDSKSTFRE